ncbi:glycosyltransferase [Prosthecobacter sp. SYSU 5D2]|uniref:glycosyltransferase n=1 Tax=Prosthecobacter sp. SYSU 5D2 TaxID=3134134 RepID=UPI0031FF2724
MALSILDVFNRYRLAGGEEFAVERIRAMLATRHQVHSCRFASEEWLRPDAPGRLSQGWRFFYNPASRRRFESAVEESGADLAVFHNLFPVGSPAIYHAASRKGIPVVQFLHNYRPFAVGSLYSRGMLQTDSLYGNHWQAVRDGVWMNSRVRTLMMATLQKMLHRSGWLGSVKKWIAISDFMRERLIEAGAVAPDRIVTLRHAWDCLPQAPEKQDAGYYLFLGRLIEEKGLPTLLDAWDMLQAQLGKATPRLHIAGEGPMAEQVRQHARTNPFICALGNVGGETKTDQLLRCRAVVVPSVWWEPLGLVTYEAYDYAKPVLAASSGGLTETVQHSRTGFLHVPGDAAGLVQDVLNLEAMSVTQRMALGNSGRHWLRQETDPTRWLRKFDEIAGEVIAPRQAELRIKQEALRGAR